MASLVHVHLSSRPGVYKTNLISTELNNGILRRLHIRERRFGKEKRTGLSLYQD